MNNQDLLDLSGKTSIVTGGAMGIGLGIANRLCASGVKVLIADLDEDSALLTAKELQSKGYEAEAIAVDVSKIEDIKKMTKQCLDLWGKIDILVNNAGIFPQSLVADLDEELFEKVIDVNLKGTYLATKFVSEEMKKQGGGKIINITSIDALHPSMPGLAHYDASKHGVWGFTKNVAIELAEHNIWVNAVAPGGIVTPGMSSMQSGSADEETLQKTTAAFLQRIPMHRMGDPDEIGKVVLFLASDMASYMTGEQIVVDGGALLA